MKRRDFLKTVGVGTLSFALPQRMVKAAQDTRPNILWILSEDICPDLSCYGEPGVETPNLDKLASEGVRFTNAFTSSPVCSTSRSAMITGMHQSAIGAHQHRSHRGDGYMLPKPVQLITDTFREAGYFTCNVKNAAPGVRGSGKTDFNFKTRGKPFDGDDWVQRKDGQPFFAQLSISITHRGGHWKGLDKKLSNPVDPAKVKIRPYYPDHPVVRKDWATYLNSIQMMDSYVGKILKRLDEEGLTDNTVVIFIGDHGRCMVRGKQWLYDAGIRIPLLVRWPGTLKAGQVSDDLISAIDISATVLDSAGIRPPDYMQGRIFLGPKAKKREYIFASRDRCDETKEIIRCVHDKRYSYIRNYMSYRPWMAWNQYKDTSYPTRNLLRQLYAEGKLNTDQARFMAPTKPPEELYDLKNDPYELNNLAKSPQYLDVLHRMRRVHKHWVLRIKDQGLIPEPILEDVRLNYGNDYNILAQPQNQDLLERIMALIESGEKGKSALPELTKAMQDEQDSIRYWAAIWIGNLNAEAQPAEAVLKKGIMDRSGAVRVASARAFCRMGREQEVLALLVQEMKNNKNRVVRHYATLELEDLGEKARPVLEAIRAARKDKYQYVQRVTSRIVDNLEKKG